MSKYYDYAQERFVDGDPSTALLAQVLGMQAFMSSLHRKAEQHKKERAAKAKADKTPFYKIYSYGEIQYVKKFLRDSYKNNETWNDRLQEYNKLLVDYLTRKDYLLKAWQRPEHYTLSVKQYKSLVKEILKK